MLVLTRHIGEHILINQGQIDIKFLYFLDGQVAIGITAPKHIDIDRKEVLISKKRSQRAANEANAIGEKQDIPLTEQQGK